MTREEILSMFARREAAWAAGDAVALTRDHATNSTVISPTGGVLEGPDEIERIYRVWMTAFPGLKVTNEDVIIDGDRVAVVLKVSGTHGGDFFGLKPTNRHVEFPGVFVFRLNDEGKIIHERRVLDFTGVLVQVGVLRAKPTTGV